MQSSILFEQVPHQHQQHTVGFTKAQEATVAGFFEAAAASNNNNLLMTLTIPSSVITSAAAAAAAADMELDDNNVPAPASPSASTISDCSSTSTPTRSKKNVSFVPYVDVYHTFHPEDYGKQTNEEEVEEGESIKAM